MHMSTGLVLVLGIAIVVGVFVLADTITPVIGGVNGVDDSANEANNSSMQVEILVRFNPELWNTTALQSAAEASHANIGATVESDYDELGLLGLQLVLLPPGMSAEEGIAYYEDLPYVLYAEPNAVYTIESTQNQTTQQVNAQDSAIIANNSTTQNPVRLLIQFNTSAFSGLDALTTYANGIHVSMNATLVKDFTKEGLSGLHLVEMPMNMTEKNGIGAYKNQSFVLFAEPNYKINLSSPVKMNTN